MSAQYEQSIAQEDMASTEEDMVSQAIRESVLDSCPEVIDLSVNELRLSLLCDVVMCCGSIYHPMEVLDTAGGLWG